MLKDKIDTQGLSGPTTEGCTDNVYPRDEYGEPIYPPFNPTPLPLIEPELREELKVLINEVLDDRLERFFNENREEE
tara:strand:+ start:720 stop:950 length:231 start_codon:yes stop_codon:yes gene_type:complete